MQEENVPIQALVDIVERSAEHLHAIRSRSSSRDVALELHRLNRGASETAAALLDPFVDPSDFAQVQLASADSTNGLVS